MRQLQPARAFFIGDTSPQSDPVRFVSAVEQLCAWHWEQQQHQAGSIPAPLVVNTAGWVKVGRLHMPSAGNAQAAASELQSRCSIAAAGASWPCFS